MPTAEQWSGSRARGMLLFMKGQKAATGRASVEAVEKRRAARHFNDVLLGGARSTRLDGRTEKRRLRLLEELRLGTARGGSKALKPIDVLLRVQALLDLDEPVTSIKKVCKPGRPAPPTEELVLGVKTLHRAYGFAVEAYQFVGIDEATLKKAGVRSRPTRPLASTQEIGRSVARVSASPGPSRAGRSARERRSAA